MLELHFFALDTDLMILDFNVLGAAVGDRIVRHLDAVLVAVSDNQFWSRFIRRRQDLLQRRRIHLTSWMAGLNAMYSASLVDSDTLDCFLLSQLTAALINMNV